MDRISVHGLCVRETDIGEADKVITLVTMEYGKISVSGKGVKSLKSRHMAATQPFCYSVFTLRKSKKYYYIEDSELIECFYELRSDLNRLSLAAYICDVCADASVENSPDVELLRLTLNALYAVNKGIEPAKVKAAFELRCAAAIGFCPELSACDVCGREDDGEMYLDVMNGRLLCRDCKPRAEKEAELEAAEDGGTARLYIIVPRDVLSAMRYIVGAPVERFISFSIDGDGLYQLGVAGETYLINHLEHGFNTLEFYKSLIL